MKIYEVGGAVRDYLLGIKPNDIDYVVVGARVEDLLNKGFVKVGKAFPVFLHPETKAEYALARKEIKTGNKHTDFEFDFSPTISLSEDLRRRDFTCNALAKDVETGKIIDECGGAEDIKNKILRHIDSEHFVEDPLRVLRMCRFSAQLDFEIAPETMLLAKKMVKENMLENLSAERIREEFFKALHSKCFWRFVKAFEECGALAHLLKNLNKEIKGIAIRRQFYYNLQNAESLEEIAKFAILFWPVTDDKKIADDCNKIKMSEKFMRFAQILCRYGHFLADKEQVNSDYLFDMLKNIGRLKDFKPAELLFSTLENLGYNQEKNQKISKKIMVLCEENRVNMMPDFKSMAKDKSIAQKYKEFILEKLKENNQNICE